MLREKIVAFASSRMIIVADESKLVVQLGSRAVAVEVIPFGWKTTAKRVEQIGAHPTLRVSAQGEAFLTDDGNYILDCAFGPMQSPATLQGKLDSVVGVVEHGLFVGIAQQVFLGGAGGVTVLNLGQTS